MRSRHRRAALVFGAGSVSRRVLSRPWPIKLAAPTNHMCAPFSKSSRAIWLRATRRAFTELCSAEPSGLLKTLRGFREVAHKSVAQGVPALFVGGAQQAAGPLLHGVGPSVEESRVAARFLVDQNARGMIPGRHLAV